MYAPPTHRPPPTRTFSSFFSLPPRPNSFRDKESAGRNEEQIKGEGSYDIKYEKKALNLKCCPQCKLFLLLMAKYSVWHL